MSRLFIAFITIFLALGMSGCQDAAKIEAEKKKAAAAKAKASADRKAQADAAAAKAKEKADAEAAAKAKEDGKEFDPRNPPPGYTNCHRNHCHKVGGGVASYAQVMQEMGATKIVGMPKSGPLPKAPADLLVPPDDAVTTNSGIITKVLAKGSGTEKPAADSIVTVHYTGWTADGKAFQSTATTGEPATVPLQRVFPGWREGMQMMVVGEERRMWIPQHLAFNGRPNAPTGTIVFDVELVSIRPGK